MQELEPDEIVETDIDQISTIMTKQRSFFNSGKTHDIDFRIKQLKSLKEAIKDYEDRIIEATQKDMKKPFLEAWAAEIGAVLDELNKAIKNIKKWSKPDKVGTGLFLFKSSSKVKPEPKGVTLIVSAWNYPFLLIFLPLISSISAGNTAIVKPSELAPNSAKIVEEIIETAFDADYVKTIQGGKMVAQELLNNKFDHILFTGSENVGRIYAKAAAEHLTPVTLEMGGKSPTIVHKSAKLDKAAERIAFGKFFNAGQTCVAPDYILVDKQVKSQFIEKLKQKLKEFYPNGVDESPDYGRIVNEGHFNRLCDLMVDMDDKIIEGGSTRVEDKFFSPTIIEEPGMESKLMKQEIFGPILPILTYEDKQEIINIVARNPTPLVMYIFTEEDDFRETIMRQIKSGSVCINDTIVHYSVSGLPIGGVGSSGMGIYCGKYGFNTFSQSRTIFERATWLPLNLLKPPYSNIKKKLLKFFLG